VAAPMPLDAPVTTAMFCMTTILPHPRGGELSHPRRPARD
jgi:hypothetical protein